MVRRHVNLQQATGAQCMPECMLRRNEYSRSTAGGLNVAIHDVAGQAVRQRL